MVNDINLRKEEISKWIFFIKDTDADKNGSDEQLQFFLLFVWHEWHAIDKNELPKFTWIQAWRERWQRIALYYHRSLESFADLPSSDPKESRGTRRNLNDSQHIPHGKHTLLETWKPLLLDSREDCGDRRPADAGRCSVECTGSWGRSLTSSGTVFEARDKCRLPLFGANTQSVRSPATCP